MMHPLRWFALLVFSLVAVSACGSGGGSGAGSGAEAAWTYVGTWINPAYSGGDGPPARIVFTDSTLAFYKKETDTTPGTAGSLTIADDWTADGGRYFKCSGNVSSENVTGIGYMLLRVSGNNNTLEANVSLAGYPAAIDPNGGWYGIWARQQ